MNGEIKMIREKWILKVLEVNRCREFNKKTTGIQNGDNLSSEEGKKREMRSLIDHKICIIGVDLVMRRRIAGFHVASSDRRRWKIITNSGVDIFIKDMLILDETRTSLQKHPRTFKNTCVHR